MRVLIVGGGVIGTSLAYCLALRGAKVTLIERSSNYHIPVYRESADGTEPWLNLSQAVRRKFAEQACPSQLRVAR